MRIHLILALTLLVAGSILSGVRAAEPPGEEEADSLPRATAAEERRIKELIAEMTLPPDLARKKREMEAASQGRALASERKAEEDEEAYKERKRKELEKKIEEVKSSIGTLAPTLLSQLEKQAKEMADGFDPDLKDENLANTVRFWTRQYNKLVSREAPEYGKLPREEKAKLVTARKKELDRRRGEEEAFWTSFGEHMKKRGAAMKELKGFGSKAVPFLNKVLVGAGWEDGTAIVEILASVKGDARFHGPVLTWFDRQHFSDSRSVPRVLIAIVRMDLPGIISHLSAALKRVSHKTKFLFLNPMYEASVINQENVGPGIDALTAFLRGTDLLSAEAAVNILLRFAQGRHVPLNKKRGVIGTLGKVAFGSSNVRTARVVAMGLGRALSPEAVSVLDRLLAHRDRGVRMSAIVSLGNLGPLSHESAETIVDYAGEGNSQRMRVAAMLALGKIRNLDSAETLIEHLGSESKSLKMAAHKALVQMFERRTDKRYNAAAWRDALRKLREERRLAEEREEEKEE